MAVALNDQRAPAQDVRFCRSTDGVRIAYARHGSGPPLVVASCWLSHLSYDWLSPVWRHFLDDLGKIAAVTRYDERGFGLSDWDVHDDFSLEARVADLEAVVDDSGLDEFSILAMAQGGPVAVSYVHRHPQRVNRLVMYGAHACADRDLTAEQGEYVETLIAMMRVGWARPESDFRRVFTNKFIPGASEAQMCWVDDLQKVSTSGHNAAEARRQRGDVDVTDLLADLDVPTLVLHARGDRMSGFAEGALLASRIPGARHVPLDSDNHIVLADEPARQVLTAEVAEFLRPEAVSAPGGSVGELGTLSSREIEILRLAAAGYDNVGIASALTLSVRTVERHLSNLYAKLGISGRSARTAAVAAWLTRA